MLIHDGQHIRQSIQGVLACQDHPKCVMRCHWFVLPETTSFKGPPPSRRPAGAISICGCATHRWRSCWRKSRAWMGSERAAAGSARTAAPNQAAWTPACACSSAWPARSRGLISTPRAARSVSVRNTSLCLTGHTSAPKWGTCAGPDLKLVSELCQNKGLVVPKEDMKAGQLLTYSRRVHATEGGVLLVS